MHKHEKGGRGGEPGRHGSWKQINRGKLQNTRAKVGLRRKRQKNSQGQNIIFNQQRKGGVGEGKKKKKIGYGWDRGYIQTKNR